jgi:molecular chaperone HscB
VANRQPLFYVMNADFSKNHFELFGIAPSFVIDTGALDVAYRDVQREVHPDRFANASDAEKRLAAQWATQANEAYRTLKTPLSRGRYLLRLNGIDTEEERNTAMPLEFLVQQMEWREAVFDARAEKDDGKLNQLATKKRLEEKRLFANLAEQLSAPTTMPNARETVRKLRFLEKLGEEIDLATEEIES